MQEGNNMKAHVVQMPNFSLIGRACDQKVCYSPVGVAMCKVEAKPLLWDLRSYGGADLNSDHKPVITYLQISCV